MTKVNLNFQVNSERPFLWTMVLNKKFPVDSQVVNLCWLEVKFPVGTVEFQTFGGFADGFLLNRWGFRQMEVSAYPQIVATWMKGAVGTRSPATNFTNLNFAPFCAVSHNYLRFGIPTIRDSSIVLPFFPTRFPYGQLLWSLNRSFRFYCHCRLALPTV